MLYSVDVSDIFHFFCSGEGNPKGPERHLNAARQKLPRDNFCRSITAQLPSPRGQFWKRKNVLSCGGEAIWEAFKEAIWVRVFACQKLPRDNGESIFAARHWDVSQGPLGRRSPRGAEKGEDDFLWNPRRGGGGVSRVGGWVGGRGAGRVFAGN